MKSVSKLLYLFTTLTLSCATTNYTQTILTSTPNPYNYTFKIEVRRYNTLIGSGTGFAAKTINNSTYILTNRHICSDDANEYTLITNNYSTYPASYYTKHEYADLCLLKTDHLFPTPTFNSPKTDAYITSIGAPSGVFPVVVSGKMKEEVVVNSRIDGERYYFTGYLANLSVDSGASGSPVFNMRQEVVGVIFGAMSMGVAGLVSGDVVKAFVDSSCGS